MMNALYCRVLGQLMGRKPGQFLLGQVLVDIVSNLQPVVAAAALGDELKIVPWK